MIVDLERHQRRRRSKEDEESSNIDFRARSTFRRRERDTQVLGIARQLDQVLNAVAEPTQRVEIYSKGNEEISSNDLDEFSRVGINEQRNVVGEYAYPIEDLLE